MAIFTVKKMCRDVGYDVIYDNPTYDYISHWKWFSFLDLTLVLNIIGGVQISDADIIRMAKKDLILIIYIQKSRQIYIHPKDVSKVVRTVLKVKKIGGFKKVAR